VSTASTLLRSDLLDFHGYRSARSETVQGRIWLNANESAWPSAADPEGSCRRYPDPQPELLVGALARLYGMPPDEVLVGRGSDEGIDLLVRTFCMPGSGCVVIAPPVFGMYAVCARLQGARVVEVPLLDAPAGYAPDLDAMANAALLERASLLFLCSPGNPTGEVIAPEHIAALAARLRNRCLVVVDEAYGEFTEWPSASTLIADNDNLVVLRTLSKAHALAGARIGCVLAARETIELLRRCQAPYPVPRPCVDAALAALSPGALVATQAQVASVRASREEMLRELGSVPGVRRIYASQANFLLVRFDDPEGMLQKLLAAGIVVRDMRAMPGLGDAMRITLGDPMQNKAVLAALAQPDPIAEEAA